MASGDRFLALQSIKLKILACVALATILAGAMRVACGTECAPGAFFVAESGAPAGDAVLASNAYERSSGRSVGDGHYDFLVADVAQATRHELASGRAAVWTVTRGGDDGGAAVLASDGESAAWEARYPAFGDYVVRAAVDGELAASAEVAARRVRRELRQLDADELERYLAAIEILTTVDDDEGLRRYGPAYRSVAWFVREHLYGAADRSCDHWHDGAGFVNHHVGITWQFENALAAVDATLAAHYWDYTIDAAALMNHWPQSHIFRDAWFGSASPGNDEHVVDAGRFAYARVLQGTNYSGVTNPYGLLRSPWNTNKVPFLGRSGYVVGQQAGGYKSLPNCADFADTLATAAAGGGLGEIQSAINGFLHGPVHIMIGGLWGLDDDIWGPRTRDDDHVDTFGRNADLSAVTMFLFAKFMWRQGIVRCPTTCAADAPQESCLCHCPAAVREKVAPPDGDAAAVLAAAGAERLTNYLPRDPDGNFLDTILDGLDHETLLDALCRVGFPGEMFTSAAPQDPTFWPLHGNAERFLQYVRLLMATGDVAIDDSWAYHHVKAASDTHVVCDWAGVDERDAAAMPACGAAICPGHGELDLLPFDDLLPGNAAPSNADFFKATLPGKASPMPYVYDSLAYWPGCAGDNLVDAESRPARDAAERRRRLRPSDS